MKHRKRFIKHAAGTMTFALCLGALNMLSFAEEASSEQLGVVETAYGLAEGVPGEAYDVTLFKGMPYAAPPVGTLRWKEPEPPQAWEGVKTFDTYADAPCQWENDMASDPWKTDFYYNELPPFSEDCLYLNIATPAVNGDEQLPVYVWFHGGGLNHGYSYEVECDPEALASKGVVVVEIQKTSMSWLQECGLTGEESLEELRSMDASVFMGDEENYGSAPQAMTVDGKYIQYDNLKEAYDEGLFGDVNILVGANLGESTQDGVGGAAMETADEFYAYFKELLGDLYEEYDFENLVQVTDEDALATARTLNSLGFSTSLSTNITAVELFGQYYDTISEHGNVYVYLFSHKTPGRNEDYYWAWHSSELWYTFASLRDIPEQRDWEEWDYELADIVTSYWANFMKNGDPNGEGLEEWLPSDSAQLAYMDLGEKDTLQCIANTDELKELMIAFCEKYFLL